MTEKPARVGAGVPSGGEFAKTAHSDSVPALPSPTGAASNPFLDADGTAWELDGDEYTDVLDSNVGGITARVTTDVREEGARATVVDRRNGHFTTIGEQTHFATVDEAKAHAKGIRERAHKYGTNAVTAGSSSPWGRIQSVENIAPGIDAVYTSGHGGLKVTAARNKDIDPAWREGTFYEEDCAWSKAAITHHQDLTPAYAAAAHETARRWYPDEYTAIVGKDPAKYGLTGFEPITAAESSIVETREFLAARAATHDRVQSVTNDPKGHPGMVAVSLHNIAASGRDEDGDPVGNARTVLIPVEEWKMPWTERRTIPKKDTYQVIDPATLEG